MTVDKLLGLISDEKGKISLSRVILACQLAYVNWYAIAYEPTEAWWSFQGALCIALVAWAAGPRGLEYLAPRVTDLAKALKDKVNG
jgi:hypothetical protein